MEMNEVNVKEVKIEEAEKKEEKTTVRDTIYGRIDVSVKTMDKVLIVLTIALIASFIIGVIV